MINDLRTKCNELLKTNSNPKLEMVNNLLKDDQIFFKISIEESYAIFKILGYPQKEYLSIYKELISNKNFE